MIQSMTGFAAKTLVIFSDKGAPVNVSISIKSLNSRFFETTCKLPFALNNLETEFIKLFKTRLLRGHIYFTIHTSRQNSFSCTVEPATDIIKGYLQSVDVIKKEFGLEGKLTLNDLLRMPNVFNVAERELEEKGIKQIFETIDILIEDVIEARKKEGATLQKDIDQRIVIMQQSVNTIEQTFTSLMERQKALIADELAQLEATEDEMADTRRQILYASLDKMDIHEEIVRFKSHLSNLVTQLGTTSIEKGKRLDFILQELAREVNTMAAKSADATIGSLAINIKVELEKIREQVQNIV